jgi:hypothetical protein
MIPGSRDRASGARVVLAGQRAPLPASRLPGIVLGNGHTLIGRAFMIVGYHLTIGAYGFWLPNDPRGSWSSFVGAYELYLAAGRATKTDERRSLARNVHDRELRRAGRQNLQRAPLKFNGIQGRAIGHGFERYFSRVRRRCGRARSCRIMCIWSSGDRAYRSSSSASN